MLIIQIYNDNNKAGNRGTRVRGLITDPQPKPLVSHQKYASKLSSILYFKVFITSLF